MSKQFAVIGGGAAGIAAAYTLLENSVDTTVYLLEATNRFGGRAHTQIINANGKPLPFDMGAVYIQDPDAPDNPWKDIAASFGFQTIEDTTDYKLRINDGSGYKTEDVTANNDINIFSNCINKGFEANKDYDNKAIISDPGALGKMSSFALGISTYGSFTESAEPWQYLAADRAREASGNWGNNLFVREGYGKLVQRYGEQIKKKYPDRFYVTFNALVTGINYTDKFVVVTYGDGYLLSVSACVVTLPVSVLERHQRMFNPLLPQPYVTALGALRLGSYKKMAVQLASIPDAIEDNINYYLYEINDTTRGIWQFYRLSFYPDNVLVIHASGDFAKALDGLPDDEVYNMFCASFDKAYDSQGFVQLLGMSNWSKNPYALGAYSYTAPLPDLPISDSTAYKARSQMRKAIDNKLFFAGEALSLQAYATVHGAYWSGQDSAINLLHKQGVYEEGSSST